MQTFSCLLSAFDRSDHTAPTAQRQHRSSLVNQLGSSIQQSVERRNSFLQNVLFNAIKLRILTQEYFGIFGGYTGFGFQPQRLHSSFLPAHFVSINFAATGFSLDFTFFECVCLKMSLVLFNFPFCAPNITDLNNDALRKITLEDILEHPQPTICIWYQFSQLQSVQGKPALIIDYTV